MNYAELEEIKDGHLEMTILPDGIEEIKELQAKGLDENSILFALIEGYLGNGYQDLSGRVGLTDSPIIGYDVDLNDDGEFEFNNGTKIWWFPDYMVVDLLEVLQTEGKLIFARVK